MTLDILKQDSVGSQIEAKLKSSQFKVLYSKLME